MLKVRIIVSNDSRDPYRQADELSIFKLVVNLWQGKWWILALTVISTLMGVAYVSTKNTNKFTAQFQQLPADQLTKYVLLNQTEVVDLTGEGLVLKFVRELQQTDAIAQAVSNSSYLEKIAEETPEDLNQRNLAFARSINIVNSDGQRSIQFETDSLEDAKGLTEEILALTNEEVRASVLVSLALWQELNEIEQEYAMREVESLRFIALQDYDRVVEMRLAFLREQLEMAQALGIEKISLFGQSNSFPGGLAIDSLHYLRGFLAIQKEIEILANRENKELFIPELVGIDRQAQAISQNTKIERVNAAVEIANLDSDNFSAVNVTFNSVDAMPKSRKLILVIAAAMAGFFAGVITFLGWRGFINFKRDSEVNAG